MHQTGISSSFFKRVEHLMLTIRTIGNDDRGRNFMSYAHGNSLLIGPCHSRFNSSTERENNSILSDEATSFLSFVVVPILRYVTPSKSFCAVLSSSTSTTKHLAVSLNTKFSLGIPKS